MALPGVKTILRDTFSSISRSGIPDGVRVAVVARRSNEKLALDTEATDPVWANEEDYTGTDSPTFRYYTNVRAGDLETDVAEEDAIPAARDYEAVRVRSSVEAQNHFGTDSELVRAYEDLAAGGAARIWLIAIPAGTDDATLHDQATVSDIFDAVEQERIDILAFHGRGYSNDSTADIGFHADNTDNAEFVKHVVDKCREVSDRSNPIFAVLGVAPATGDGEGLTASEVTAHLDLSNLPANDLENGAYASIIVTELRPVGSDDGEYSNGAAIYAGYVGSLDAENAPTGKTLYNISELRYIPTRDQQQGLVDKGTVPVSVSQSRTPKIVDGQTFGKDDSDYKRLSTLRIVFDAVQLVRQVGERYIGMPATMHHRNAMETDITSNLRGMVVNGALLDADFEVEYLPRENRAIIDLVLTPAFEFRNIDIRVSIQL